MARTINGLRWEKQRDRSWYAFAGQHVFGMVGQREDGSCYWNATSLINPRWIGKGTDLQAKSVATGRRAINRLWSRFLDQCALRPDKG